MAGFTNSTFDALAGLKGPALEFLVFIHDDMEAALALLGRTVRASDAASVEELRRLRGAHEKRAEAIARARE
jgi:hypothetical protein